MCLTARGCDICNHVFSFKPIYDARAPERLGLGLTLLIIVKRIIGKLYFYSRVLVSSFAWLIWVPFVTAWTWRLFLNPVSVLEDQPPGVPTSFSNGAWTLALEQYVSCIDNRYLHLPDGSLALLSAVESMYDWKAFVTSFFSDVFEGQIICAVVIVLALVLLLIREYIIANAPEGPPEPAPRPVPPGIRDQLAREEALAELRRHANVLEERRANALAEQRNRVPMGGRAAARPPLEEAQRQTRSATASHISAPEPVLDVAPQPSSSAPVPQSPRAENTTARSVTGSPASKSASETGDTHYPSSRYNLRPRTVHPRQSSPHLPQITMPKGNVRNLGTSLRPTPDPDTLSAASSPLRMGLGEPLSSPASKSPAQLPLSPADARGGGDIPARENTKGKGKLVLDDGQEAEPHESAPAAGYPHASGSLAHRDLEKRERENMRAIDRELQEMLWPSSPNNGPAGPNPGLHNRAPDPIFPPALPVDQPPNQVDNRPDANDGEADLDMVVNFGIADGEIVAQLEVNNVRAFLDLVGVQGPFSKLVQTVALVHLIIFMVLGIGIWVPYLIGSSSVYLFFSGLVPIIDWTVNSAISLVQQVSDPIVEPIADALISMLNISANQTSIQSLPELVTPAVAETSDDFLGKTLQFLGGALGKMAGGVTSELHSGNTTAYGPYHPNFFQAFKEDLSFVFLGYSVIFVLLLAYANHASRFNDPFLDSITRFAQLVNSQISAGTKVFFFIMFELCCFPFYCGLLIDICTLPVLSSSATIAGRYVLYQNFPWMFVGLHWIIGTTFMFHVASYVAMVREMFRPGVLWFLKDPNDPNFNAITELLKRTIFSQLRKLLTGMILYGTVIFGVFGGGITLIRLSDYVVAKVLGENSLLQVLPLRLDDSISEIPFDLFFFHYVLPTVLKMMKPDERFRALVNAWFVTAAKFLRITHFLLGRDEYEEQSDAESDLHGNEDLEIRYLTVNRPFARKRPDTKEPIKLEVLDEDGGLSQVHPSTDHDWEDDASLDSTAADNKQQHTKHKAREFSYMRVPNHDNIEVVPREKMLIPMREEDPVFGRPHESEEDVARNWTKVYVPEHFYYRVRWVV
ncbi:hypothetical protein HDU91_001226 [Kappamyces sp. JEL0680]|nr:hypothetical protein HDU91_001226 [Kappamyces sp. JEL0680]